MSRAGGRDTVNEKNRNLVVRIASAALLLPLVVFLLLQGGYFSAGLLAAAAGVCAAEYYAIALHGLGPIAWLGIAAAAVMPILPVWRPAPGVGAWAFAIVSGFFFLAWIVHLVRGPLAEAPGRVGHLLTGLLYGAIGLTSLSALRQAPHGLDWVWCTLIVTWGNDTAAYFAGRLLGRRKLYPAVSPNKTWEGFAGGMAGSVAGMFIARATFFPQLSAIDCLVVGIAAGILGPVGDLCESMFKRAFQVKDSGRIIPGHGGLLDRIDALIFNAPMVFVYAALLHRGG